MEGNIDTHLYHLGLYILYPYLGSQTQEEDKEALGKKRDIYLAALPKLELKNNDDFLSSIWSDLIEQRYPEVGEEIVRVPALSEVRMLFTAERFGNYTGRYYSDADWIEALSGKLRLEVNKWVGEKDPMTPEPKKEGMIEGYITLGHAGSGGLRHFVNDKSIHDGSYHSLRHLVSRLVTIKRSYAKNFKKKRKRVKREWLEQSG